MRLSRLPSVIGLCASDIPGISNYLNAAQSRLLYAKEAGEEGWWGTWAEIGFNASQDQPYITLPREVARIEAVNICNRPIPIRNQFYEYLTFGNGRMPKQYRAQPCGMPLTVYTRNNVPTFTDLSNAPQKIVVYSTDAADNDRRVFIQGLDPAGNVIRSQDGFSQVQGIYVTLAYPSVVVTLPDSATQAQFSAITGIQKDITAGQVQIMQLDPMSGSEKLLLTMEATEQTAWYRRYYFDNLPYDCCHNGTLSTCSSSPSNVQVTAIAKLEPTPIMADPDYCIIQNKEALIEECAAIRYSEMDTVSAKQMSQNHHRQAIALLNGELDHYLGKNSPAIQFAPFGTADLRKQKIGTMI